MDFKISKNTGSIGIRREVNASVATRGSEQAEDSRAALTKKLESASKDELASYGKEQAATGDDLVTSNIKNILATANEALDEMLYLKTEQLILSRQAEALPETTKMHTDLTEEADALRIQSDLPRNTPGLLTPSGLASVPQSYSTSEFGGTSQTNIVIPGLAQTSSSKQLVLSSTRATIAIENVEEDIFLYRANKVAYSAAGEKANQINPISKKEIFTVKDERPNTLESIEEAQRLAGAIAQKLGSAYGNEESVSKLIESSTEGLSLERVKGLLS